MSIIPLKIRFFPDPCLREKTITIKEIGSSERMLINSMIVALQESKGLGLAAPQVGINQKLFVADVGDGPMVFVNPKITKKTGSTCLEEGCLSIPGINIDIKRPEKILVKYMDENNKIQERPFNELLARVIQHETDHLNGKLILDYASDEESEIFKDQLEELAKQFEESKE